jgi:hypothetical protein
VVVVVVAAAAVVVAAVMMMGSEGACRKPQRLASRMIISPATICSRRRSFAEIPGHIMHQQRGSRYSTAAAQYVVWTPEGGRRGNPRASTHVPSDTRQLSAGRNA